MGSAAIWGARVAALRVTPAASERKQSSLSVPVAPFLLSPYLPFHAMSCSLVSSPVAPPASRYPRPNRHTLSTEARICGGRLRGAPKPPPQST